MGQGERQDYYCYVYAMLRHYVQDVVDVFVPENVADFLPFSVSVSEWIVVAVRCCQHLQSIHQRTV